MYFKPRIFISSTMGDKLLLRSKIKNMFESSGADVALYEKDLTPSVEKNTYRNDILQTDFIIFIIDERYGAKTETGLSGTEEEFRIAASHQKPCHVYLKAIEKTAEAESFENLIKSNGISYYYYKDDTDLLKKLKSTCFTISKEICISNLLQQKLEPNLINKLAMQKDYTTAIYYARFFEKVLEISNNTPYNMTNSNLLIAALDFVCDNYLKNKNIFIDKNLEMLLRNVFSAVKDANEYIALNSTNFPNFQTIELFQGVPIQLSFNNWGDFNHNNIITTKVTTIFTFYNNFKAYIANMKFEIDLL